jgi:pimeloyl-ACP methyl ester carboxylesterase
VAGNRTGIVFVNSLSLPRSATGDSAVYWAESYALRGYPSFRLDLPGLGDSDGDIPADLLGFINTGGYTELISAAITQLVERFGMSGVVVVGHCAGAATAIYGAAANKVCKGLILLDPYFYLVQIVRPKIRDEISDLVSKSGLGGIIRKVYDSLRQVRLLLRRNAPPGNANFPLLACWKHLASAGLPILIMNALGRDSFGTKSRMGEFDYLQYVLKLAGRRGQVTIKPIGGTDHSFANRVGRATVREHSENWLNDHFPLKQHEEPSVSTLRVETSGGTDYGKKAEQYLHG